MAMITGITVNKTSTDRSADRAIAINGSANEEVAGYYSAILRTIQSHQASQGLASYAVGLTSCSRGEGVTTVAANLAIAAARGGHRRVLLVDANAGSTEIARRLHITGICGLTDVLSGTSLIGDCVQLSSLDSLCVLPAGSSGKSLGSDFEVSEVVDLLDELKSEFGLIIFDLPQAEELSACYAYAQVLNGTFLVIEANRVDAKVARRVTQRFAHCQATLLGAIYNKQT